MRRIKSEVNPLSTCMRKMRQQRTPWRVRQNWRQVS